MRLKQFISAAVFVAAVVCIAAGINGVWRSFREFDDTILEEKDNQFYSTLRSDDISIENSLDSLMREADSFFERNLLKQYRTQWEETGKTGRLKAYFESNTLKTNPVYTDLLMTRNDKVIVSASGYLRYSFLNGSDSRGCRLARNEEDGHFLVYEYDAGDNIRYAAVIDFGQLYTNAFGDTPIQGLMLMDRTGTVLIRRPAQEVIVTRVDGDDGYNVEECKEFLLSCQKNRRAGGASIELVNEEGKKYTARMVVIPSSGTTNSEFALGMFVNYEAAAKPSKAAARKLLVYGGFAIGGVLMLIFMLILLRRLNRARDTELEDLKKRNETVEEINQKMLALAHHQRLETIGTMTASIAHEFNNLLTPIMGYSIMSMEMLPEDAVEIQENLMEVYNASVKAKDIVTRLSDLSKKGREENFAELNPNETIRSALKITLPAKPKNVEVKGSFSASKSLIRGDATQISQLVMNITLNAYDAMREDGGTLFVSTKVEDGSIVVKFRDSGPGMSPETVARIFDPFYTTKESGKGTGLGLAIAAQIVDTHGGRIYVDSHPGEGTEFRISFPVIEKSSIIDRARTIQISASDLREKLDAD